MPPPRLLGQAALSMLDQACLSALNLALGLILIRLVSKDAYGVYSQIFAAGLFATSMLEALVSNPMVNLASGRSGARLGGLIENMGRYQGRISTGLAVILGALCAGWSAAAADQAHPLLLGLAFGLFVKANALREYARSVAFLDFKPVRVLRIDLLYAACVLLGTLLLARFDRLGLEALFLVFALANVLAHVLADVLAPGPARAPAPPGRGGAWIGRSRPARADYAETVGQAWKRGRLGVPGAGLAWGVNYSYLYLAALWLGPQAPAELTASRLLLMPISLCVVAWSRVARPRIGQLLAQPDAGRIHRLLLRSVAALVALALLYIALLQGLFPWLQVHVLAGKYDTVQPLLLWWGLYFVVYTARWVGTMALMGQDAYGYMLIESILSFIAIFVALKVAVDRHGLPGAIIALIAVELFSLAMTWGRYWYQNRS
ncbi:lipopolysaccharide biosynthesis protein [Castellaniella defragrans]|uniref:O-antigen/teichoic acid export membrane protein n=1 Tax=Castellaniella defragrans TaxID=75697 RepID=A0A7W9TM67_CASDE|nr:hypothetical protein [Castellaniella defragrans]KAB0609134.1 hypothetical protein F7Q88_12695 [Castellaniella defragrans]MBB6083295.1 O-antigen/teichoic acid export membrane protein [Castellaniella defragrans]